MEFIKTLSAILQELFPLYDEDEDIELRNEKLFHPAEAFPNRYKQESRAGDVLSIHTATQLKVIILRPTAFENVSEIANHITEGQTVLLNLELLDKAAARRTIDFISGAVYAVSGCIKRVSVNAYIITPFEVDILDEFIGEIENSRWDLQAFLRQKTSG